MESPPVNKLDQQLAAVKQSDERMLGIRGYAGRFTSLFIAYLGLLAMQDLHDAQTSQILISFGLQSVLCGWLWLIGGAMLTWWLAQRVALNFYFLRVVKYYQDSSPLGPIEAGSFDISVWGSLLSYISILFLASLAPGRLGLLRPVAIVVSSMLSASVLSIVLTSRAIRVIYGPSRQRKSISRIQCEMTSGKGAQCERWAFRARFLERNRVGQERAKEFCRWHHIVIATAKRNLTRPRVTIGMQYRAAFCLLFMVLSFWNFMLYKEVVWLAVGVVILGATLRYLFDSIMSVYHALSKLAIWAKLTATGLTLQVTGGITLLVLVGWQPELMQPLVAYFWQGQAWLAFGPTLVYVLMTLLTAVALDALAARILFFDSPSVAPLFVLPTYVPLWRMLSSAFAQYWPLSVWLNEQFWSAGWGNESKRMFGVAFILNWALFFTLRQGKGKEYRSTVTEYVMKMLAIFGPAMLTLISLLASRYVLYFAGISGPLPFLAVSLMLSLALTILFLWVSSFTRRPQAN
jgi:hypothetical protein